jgi:signal transduction histidine kinase
VRDRAVLQAIIEHAPIAIIFRDPDGNTVTQNELGRRMVEMLGDPPPERWSEFGERFTWEDGRGVTHAEWDGLLQAAEKAPIENVVQARSLPTFVTHFVVAPVREEADGRLLGTVTIVRDVSAEHAIRKLREELVAVIAHDLRSPIGAIGLSLDKALQHVQDPNATVAVPATVLQRMQRSVRQLREMVGDLLDASRVELGALSIDREDVDVRAFTSELANDLAPSLRGHPVDLDLPQHPLVARVDRVRLTQVVTNLLDNASKYSREGSTIRVALRDEGDALHLSVADEGEGIVPDDLPKLFDRFYQAKRSRQRRAGLGLGLYITKGIVDAHGGSLTVQSAVGVGSTFHVRLPKSRE